MSEFRGTQERLDGETAAGAPGGAAGTGKLGLEDRGAGVARQMEQPETGELAEAKARKRWRRQN